MRPPPGFTPFGKMKRFFRKLAVAVVVLVWLGALAYLLVLSRKKLPEPGTVFGGEPHRIQVKYCPCPSYTSLFFCGALFPCQKFNATTQTNSFSL